MAGAKPDFFIVGAPRCGTTALYSWLRQHPDVYMPRRKEPRYFATDLDSGSAAEGRYFVRTEDDYLRLFADAGAARRVGEATSLYLFSREAARRIRAFQPEARILALLRDPVDLMVSFHGERFANGNEDVADFASALALEPARARGERIPPGGHIPRALQYREVARLADQAERYVAAFGRQRILFLLLEDLARDPRAAYREALSFLDLDAGFEPSFAVVNAGKRIRSRRVRDWTERSLSARRLARSVLPVRARNAVKRSVRRWNAEPAARPALDPALRRRLTEEMAPEVRRLAELTGRDLSHWGRA